MGTLPDRHRGQPFNLYTTSLREAKTLPAALAALALVAAAFAAGIQEAAIRKNLAERVPGLNRIDEVRKMPMPGLYEIRIENEIFTPTLEGNFHGNLFDTKEPNLRGAHRQSHRHQVRRP